MKSLVSSSMICMLLTLGAGAALATVQNETLKVMAKHQLDDEDRSFEPGETLPEKTSANTLLSAS